MIGPGDKAYIVPPWSRLLILYVQTSGLLRQRSRCHLGGGRKKNEKGACHTSTHTRTLKPPTLASDDTREAWGRRSVNDRI